MCEGGFDMHDIGKELQEIRESQIRTEESIKALADSTRLKLELSEKTFEATAQNLSSEIEALRVRIDLIETDRKFYRRTILSEVIKYGVGLIIVLISLKAMIP